MFAAQIWRNGPSKYCGVFLRPQSFLLFSLKIKTDTKSHFKAKV